MVQVGGKHKDLNLIFRIYVHKLGTSGYICYPKDTQAKTGGALPAKLSFLSSSKRLCSNKTYR